VNRRDFLKAAAVFSIAGIGVALFPKNVQARIGDRLVRGTRDGRLLESTDGGKTWLPTVNFGPGYTVRALYHRKDLVFADLTFQGYPVTLKSSDGRVWYTQDYVDPRQA